jgi:MFS family permease
VEKFHYAVGAAGLTGTVYIHLASAVAVPFAGWLADRLCRRLEVGRMAVQGAGLVVGAAFVYLVGSTKSPATLLLAMTCFGVGKGCYDSGIFASLYDTIEARARGTAAGLMNTVGWAGGALGPVVVGFASKYGRHAGDAVANMSEAIAAGAIVYILGAVLVLAAALVFARRAVGGGRSTAPAHGD